MVSALNPIPTPVSTTGVQYVVQPVFMSPGYYGMQNYQYRARLQGVQQQKLAELLKEQFPNGFIIIISILYILVGIAAIILQSILIRGRGSLYFVGAGIWGALPCFILASIFLSLSNKFMCLNLIN